MAGRVIQVQKIQQQTKSGGWADTVAEFCCYYPAYTFKMARTLPMKRMLQMIRVARRLEAAKYHNLVQIAAAPHSKNGEGVKKLMQHYEGIIKNG